MHLILSLFIPLVLLAGTPEKKINLCYDAWPPSTIFPSSADPRRGFTIEMMQEIFSKRGYKVIFQELPYARAMQMTKLGHCNLLAEVPEGQEKDVVFPQETTFSYKQAFFVRKGSPWRYNGVSSLKGLRIGNIVGYDYSSIDSDYHRFLTDPKNAAQITMASGTDGILQLMQMIAMGRIDTFNEAYLIGSYVMTQNKLSDQISIGGVIKKPLLEKPAFAPNDPETPKLMKIWDEERYKLRQSKRDLLFLEKYGLHSID
jgi:polar amino acid transport system substrate-binding protein